MEKQPWTPKYQQSVATGLERRDEVLNNGNCDNLLDTAEINSDANEKCDKSHVQNDLEAAVNEKSKQKIQNILEQVNTLFPIEKLLLYLKLPTENTINVDPLRQPLNPLGSRTEISQTIMWIKTHLIEDPEISLQKRGVYEEYVQYCGPNNIKPLSTADFGKVMKQVYPQVRPRRLGTRGNSQYCYSGLRKRVKLSSPLLPDLSDKPMSTEAHCNSSDLSAAVWIIVKEWSETKLGTQFQTLNNLAYYLVQKLSVGAGSNAASVVTSAIQNQQKGDMSSNISNTRHRETMRKILQKCENKDQKRKLQVPHLKTEQKTRSKKPKVQPTSSTSSSTSPIAVNESKTSPSQGLQPVCDKSLDFTNLQALPDFSSFQRPTGGDRATEKQCDVTVKDSDGYGNVNAGDGTPVAKIAIPRLNTKQSPVLSPKRTKNIKYKHIQPKPEQCDIASYNPQPSLSAAETRSQETVTSKSKKARRKDFNCSTSSLDDEQSSVHFPRERLISIGNVSKDAFDDYLGTNNSQENEEELMKYFANANNADTPEHDPLKNQKLSQLRLLLEQNGVPQENQIDSNATSKFVASNSSAFSKTNKKSTLIISSSHERPSVSLPPNVQSSIIGSARRRVSFDTHIHEDVPQSPNTRTKIFSFTPISPGPHSPTGRQSKCSSTNASPFVSPRNTPVPRARGNSHPFPGTQNASHSVIPIRKQINLGKKIKHELDLNLDVNHPNNPKELYKTHINMPMSAPPSPQTNLLQNLLNSNQKYSYNPNYTQTSVHNINMVDQLSPEVSNLLSANVQQPSLEPSLRSQSVPANVVQDACYSHFTFNLPPNSVQNPVQNDFNDIDTFTEDENINVNKIIDTIGHTNLGTFLGSDNLTITPSKFTIVDSPMEINDNINIPMESENYFAASSARFEKCIENTRVETLTNLCTLDQSQALDMDDNPIDSTNKCNPSRSVPSTPIPYSKTKLESIKIDVNHYSRSYPSTPLANEAFNYNQMQDYLLNGQPIKEKICENANEDMGLMPTFENKSDIFENTEMFGVANLSNLIPDNKNNFNFGQISEGSFGAKRNIDPVLNRGCDDENDYFKSVPDLNGS